MRSNAVRTAVPLLLVAACAHTREPTLPAARPLEASAETPAANIVDAAVEAEADASEARPLACSDAGLPAWYVVTTGEACGRSSTLRWIDADGALHDVSAPNDPLLAELRWIAQLPTWCMPDVAVTEVRRVRRTGDVDEFRIKLEGHELGGMTCHAITLWDVVGHVVVDRSGAIVSADFQTLQTVAASSALPACHGMSGETRGTIRMRRSCKP